MKGSIPKSIGDSNDHPGKGSLGGKSTAKALEKVGHKVEENTTAGNAVSHGVISGIVPTNGAVGECPVACNLGVAVAAEGAGEYGREHTIGGCAAASGKIGKNPVVGTSGGTVHASDADNASHKNSNKVTTLTEKADNKHDKKESCDSTEVYAEVIGLETGKKASVDPDLHSFYPKKSTLDEHKRTTIPSVKSEEKGSIS